MGPPQALCIFINHCPHRPVQSRVVGPACKDSRLEFGARGTAALLGHNTSYTGLQQPASNQLMSLDDLRMCWSCLKGLSAKRAMVLIRVCCILMAAPMHPLKISTTAAGVGAR